MVTQRKSLGEFLVEQGVLSEEQLNKAKNVQKDMPGDLGDILLDLEFATERDVARGRAQEIGLEYVDLSKAPIDADAIKLIPEHMIRRHNVLGIKKDSTSNRLWVAVADPALKKQTMDEIRIVSKHQPIPVFVSKTDLKDAIAKHLTAARPGAKAVQGAAISRPGAKPISGNGANGNSANGHSPNGHTTAMNGNGRATGPLRDGGAALPALIKDESLTPAVLDAQTGTIVPVTAGGHGASNGNGASGGDGIQTSGNGAALQKSDLSDQLQGELLQMVGIGDDEDEDAMRDLSDDAPIIRISHTIIQQAIREGASDIHIEPEKRGVRIRYRIDGVLNEIMTVPNHIKQPLIARFKIMADMNIAERRVPQDGRIPIRSEGKDYDLRVNTVPTVSGEKIVMRVLDKGSIQLTMDQLGFEPSERAKVEEIVAQPQGMLLITGPTGSGKTTTLYSILNRVSTVEKNVMTAEDPAEYQLPGINQVSMNKKAGLTFSTTLRAFLRQDPDIIMVGEMRDLETSQIAVEAALTGHFVLSTLHTNDAPAAILRLADMGVETFLIANTVTGVIAQRLARRICSQCKEAYQAPASTLRRFGFAVEDPNKTITLYHGTGCERCRGTGYKGRIGLYELMTMNDEIRELVVMRSPLADIRKAAKANGMKEMREDGLWKVLEGMTTPDEVMRVVFTAGMG